MSKTRPRGTEWELKPTSRLLISLSALESVHTVPAVDWMSVLPKVAASPLRGCYLEVGLWEVFGFG